MGEQVGSLYYDVTLETGGMIAGQRKVEASLGSMARSGDQFAAKFSAVAAAVSAAISAIAIEGLVNKIVTAQRQFDVLFSSLKTVTGGIDKASAAWERLVAFAATTPYSLEQSVAGFVKLKALGLDPSERSMTSFGNTASAMGKDLQQMIEAVADASTGEFERLKEFGIKAKTQGDQVSMTFQGVTTTIKNSAAEITDYLVRIGEVNFDGAMADRMKTLDGAMSNLGDAWDQLYLAIAQSGLGDQLADIVRSVSRSVEQMTISIQSGGLTEYFDNLRVVMGLAEVAAITLAGAVTGRLVAALAQAVLQAGWAAAAIATTTTAASAFSSVMAVMGGPIGIAITALGLLILNWDKVAGSAKSAAEISEQSADRIAKALSKSAKAGAADLERQRQEAEKGLAEAISTRKRTSVMIYRKEAKEADLANLDEVIAAYRRNLADISAAKGQLSAKDGSAGWGRGFVSPDQGGNDGRGKGNIEAQGKLLEKYATDAEKLAAELKKASEAFGGMIPQDVEKRIRDSFAKKGGPKKTAAERFDSEAYLSDLRKAQTSEINTINETEAEKLRIAKKNLAERKISEGEYQQAVTLITQAAEGDRAELMRKTQDQIDADRKEADRQALEDRKAHAEEVRKAMEYGATLTKAVNPVDALRQEYEAKLALVTQYEQMMAAQGVDATLQAQMARTQITNEHELQRRALAEQTFRSQGEAQAFLMDSVNALSSTATSSITGLLSGTMSAQDAMRSLASTVLNEAVGALVQIGVTQVKNALLADTLAAADAAKKSANGAVYAASISAQVTGMSALAAQNAFAATAAIPIIGPGLAPAAAAAAGTAAMALGTPAIATAPIAGARQYGGQVTAGSMYRVNEGGRPEMFTAANGNQYLMPTQGGRVTPMGSGGGAASSGGGAGWVGDINVNVNIAPDGTARTSTEATGGDATLARQIGDRIAIGTKETMLKELRPGGLLWKLKMGQT